ncbi:MAG: MBL fold metallo-hydrolase [Oscillatoriales cyanobacterium]|nr:MAG: MBL fold metallo-hydrolase [Oscillatoriales cyanobacterium]
MELECYPYAVGHANEGVCLWVKIGPYGVLLDCGLEDPHPVLVGMTEGRPINAIVCSHAHQDHARGLRSLQLALPNRPIYASEVTAKLLPLNWPGQQCPPQPRTLAWQSPIEIAPNLWLELIPAGHLPGAAITQLTYTGAKRLRLTYSGDILLSNSRMTSGLDLEALHGSRPDVAIIAGRYGTARYDRRRSQENQIAAQIERWFERQPTIVLPIPALGLAQELLAMFRAHHHFTGRDLDIWVDQSIAEVCDLYLEMVETFPSAVQNFARHQSLFWDDRIRPRVHRFEAIEPLLETPAPRLILVDATADLTPYLIPQLDPVVLFPRQRPRPRTALPPQIPHDTYHLSEHCDSAGIAQLVHNLRPQHLVFVNGPLNYLADLSNLNELYDRYQVHCPQAHRLLAFPLHLNAGSQAPLPVARYEGEVNEQRNQAMIVLPTEIQADLRWQKLADTGIVELRWQGEDLLIRGMLPSELLDNKRQGISLEATCCANCVYCRGQQCRNPLSPLSDRRVSPEGYCPVFEAVDTEF